MTPPSEDYESVDTLKFEREVFLYQEKRIEGHMEQEMEEVESEVEQRETKTAQPPCSPISQDDSQTMPIVQSLGHEILIQQDEEGASSSGITPSKISPTKEQDYS